MYGSVGPPHDSSAKAKGVRNLISFLAANSGSARAFVVFTAVYWTAFTTQQLMVKDVVSGSAHFWHKEPMFPYPLFLTGVINGLGASFCIVAVIATRLVAKTSPNATWSKALVPNITARQVQIMLLAGLLEGVERGCMNKSFEWLTLATRTQLFSTQIAFTFAVAWLCGLEQVDIVRLVSIGILVVGGLVQGFGMSHMKSGTTPTMGILLVIASMIASSMRWSLIQIVHQISHANSDGKKPGQMLTISMISIAKPVDCIFCIGMSFVFENVHLSTVYGDVLKAWWLLGLTILCTVLSDYNIVRIAGAVAFGVVANLGNLPMIIGGVVFNEEHLIFSQVMGFSICTCGALLYYASRAGLFDSLAQQLPEKTKQLSLTGKLMEEGVQGLHQGAAAHKPTRHEG